MFLGVEEDYERMAVGDGNGFYDKVPVILRLLLENRSVYDLVFGYVYDLRLISSSFFYSLGILSKKYFLDFFLTFIR